MSICRPARPYSITVSDGSHRDRLRELLDAVVDADNTDVGDMARSSYASEFHFSREVRRLTGESPAALRRRIMLERAAWRLHRGESVSAVAADEGWSSAEVFSRAFSRTFGVPPSRAADIGFRLPAPNGLHFHPPQSLWLDSDGDTKEPDISQLMVAHDIADTAHLIDQATALSKEQWTDEISPGQEVLEWDGPNPASVRCSARSCGRNRCGWPRSRAATFRDEQATQPDSTTPEQLAAHHEDIGKRWSAMVSEYSAEGRLGDTVIDALCDPPESFQLYGIVAHVLTYSAHRRGLARAMLARHGVRAGGGDPLEWMRGN